MALEDLGGDAWGEDEVRKFVAAPGTLSWGVEESGRLRAFLLASVYEGEAGGHVVVRQLACEPAARGRGYPGVLVSRLLDRVADPEGKPASALVRQDDLDSQVFYRGLGFRYDPARQDAKVTAAGLYRLWYEPTDELRPA